LSLLTSLLQLARSPRVGSAAILVSGHLRAAAILVGVATIVAAAGALRSAADLPLAAVLYGDGSGQERSTMVTALLGSLGRERTAVVLALVERSWGAIVLLTAFAPAFYWLLGGAAIHAAARLRGRRRPYRPLLVLLGYAVALTRIPADLAAAILGSGRGAGSQLAALIGIASLVLLGVIAWRGIQAHYGLARGPALSVLGIAVALFYVVPFMIIVLVAIAILVAAALLGYLPGL